jgi:hypothetical protein
VATLFLNRADLRHFSIIDACQNSCLGNRDYVRANTQEKIFVVVIWYPV